MLDEKSQEQVKQEAEKLAEVIELKGSLYKFRGRCKECGWQSFQFEEQAAKDMVKNHAQSHYIEILTQQLGQSAGAGGRQQPEGADKPGQQHGSAKQEKDSTAQPAPA